MPSFEFLSGGCFKFWQEWLRPPFNISDIGITQGTTSLSQTLSYVSAHLPAWKSKLSKNDAVNDTAKNKKERLLLHTHKKKAVKKCQWLVTKHCIKDISRSFSAIWFMPWACTEFARQNHSGDNRAPWRLLSVTHEPLLSYTKERERKKRRRQEAACRNEKHCRPTTNSSFLLLWITVTRDGTQSDRNECKSCKSTAGTIKRTPMWALPITTLQQFDLFSTADNKRDQSSMVIRHMSAHETGKSGTQQNLVYLIILVARSGIVLFTFTTSSLNYSGTYWEFLFTIQIIRPLNN